MGRLTLYSYFRSSAAYRVRIALALKGLDYSQVPVHLLRNDGEHHAADYLAHNPQGLVPTLLDDETPLIQSTAICEYLEEVRPTPPLLPTDPLQRAYVRSIMAIVACEIHPLNNLRVLAYLTGKLGVSEDGKMDWYRHWVMEGLSAIEQIVQQRGYAGRFCCGDTAGLGDAFLIPQIFNAKRFGLDLQSFPRLQAIDQACLDVPAFHAAHPSQQPDFPGE